MSANLSLMGHGYQFGNEGHKMPLGMMFWQDGLGNIIKLPACRGKEDGISEGIGLGKGVLVWEVVGGLAKVEVKRVADVAAA